MRLLTAPATTISHLQAVGWATGHKSRLAGRRHDVFEILLLLLLLILLIQLLLLLLQLLLLLLARLTLAGRAASTPGKGGPGRPIVASPSNAARAASSGQVPAECERGRPTGHLRAAGGVRSMRLRHPFEPRRAYSQWRGLGASGALLLLLLLLLSLLLLQENEYIIGPRNPQRVPIYHTSA